MGKTDKAIGVDYAHEWHATEFKYIDFLFVPTRDGVILIGQADKREFFHTPIKAECARTIRPNGKDFYSTTCILTIIISQARQLRATVGSEKSSQKSKHNIPASIIHEANRVPMVIGQLKLRRRFTGIKQVRH
jgi:hypothetical protein